MTRTRTRVTVVGAGVIGLSIAHDLAADGYDVTIVADVDTSDTVSAVAAALWFPHDSEQSEVATRLLEQSRGRFDKLATDAATGVTIRMGTVVERSVDVNRAWMRMAPGAVEAPVDDLPAGAVSGVRATLPLINIPIYLDWLRRTVAELGVSFVHRKIDDVSSLRDSADVVVVAAGIRGGELLGDDDSPYPIRGQVLRLANPGLTEWITDDENPEGITYVFPRTDDVIVGGTGDANAWETEIDPQTEAAILKRAIALVPALAGQPVLSRAIGLRPARPTIRLEQLHGPGIPTIAAYGHGGAGVTLSWGTAERVLDLVRQIRL